GPLRAARADRVEQATPDPPALMAGEDVDLRDLQGVAQPLRAGLLARVVPQPAPDHVIPPLPGGAVEPVGEADDLRRLGEQADEAGPAPVVAHDVRPDGELAGRRAHRGR